LVNHNRIFDDVASETLLADLTEKKPKDRKDSLGVTPI
jgi:hypothetical protein